MIMLSCSRHMSCFNFHLNKVSLNPAAVHTSERHYSSAVNSLSDLTPSGTTQRTMPSRESTKPS